MWADALQLSIIFLFLKFDRDWYKSTYGSITFCDRMQTTLKI